MELLRERCSALGYLMVGAELGGKPNITEKQLIQLRELQEKGSKSQLRTDLEAKEKEEVKAKLSKGSETHVKNKWYGEYFEFQKHFSNKYTRNGNEQEEKAIRDLGKLLGYPFSVKNEKHFENEFIHGTPDWLPKTFGVDVKNVFEPNGLDLGLPLDNLYEWQAKGYCWLTDRDHWLVVKMLQNKSEAIIRHQARSLWVEASPENSFYDTIPDDFIDDVREMYNFEGKRSLEERINVYHVELFEKDKELIKQQIELAREFYSTIKTAKELNKELIERFTNT